MKIQLPIHTTEICGSIYPAISVFKIYECETISIHTIQLVEKNSCFTVQSCKMDWLFWWNPNGKRINLQIIVIMLHEKETVHIMNNKKSLRIFVISTTTTKCGLVKLISKILFLKINSCSPSLYVFE